MIGLSENEVVERLNELPLEIKNSAIKFLQEKIGFKTRQEILKYYRERKDSSWIPEDFFREIKQVLEDYVCPEEELPALSWTPYIYGLLEFVLGLR